MESGKSCKGVRGRGRVGFVCVDAIGRRKTRGVFEVNRKHLLTAIQCQKVLK